MKVEKYKGRHWAVYDESGRLICVCLYKRGAKTVLKLIRTLMDGKSLEKE